MAENENFETWLSKKLSSLDLDEEVYLEYITGILDEEGTDPLEVEESLQEILSGVLENNVEGTVKDILKSWTKQSPKQNDNGIITSNESEADIRIKNIIEQQQSQVVAKTKRNVDKDLKRMVLQQYATASGEESDGDESDDDLSASDFVNSNVQSVIEEQQAKRDKAKQENDEKKLRDKGTRDKDKLKSKERQEKEKKRTQKGERRR